MDLFRKIGPFLEIRFYPQEGFDPVEQGLIRIIFQEYIRLLVRVACSLWDMLSFRVSSWKESLTPMPLTSICSQAVPYFSTRLYSSLFLSLLIVKILQAVG